MLQGTWQSAVIASGAAISAEVDLGRVCDSLLVIVPTLDDATKVSFQVSEASGGTFQDLHITDPADGGNNQIISAADTGGYTWAIPLGGFQFIKVKVDNNQDAKRTFRVCGIRS